MSTMRAGVGRGGLYTICYPFDRASASVSLGCSDSLLILKSDLISKPTSLEPQIPPISIGEMTHFPISFSLSLGPALSRLITWEYSTVIVTHLQVFWFAQFFLPPPPTCKTGHWFNAMR